MYCRSFAGAHRSCQQALSERSDYVNTLVLCACLLMGEAGEAFELFLAVFAVNICNFKLDLLRQKFREGILPMGHRREAGEAQRLLFEA